MFVHISFNLLYILYVKKCFNDPISFLQSEKSNIAFTVKNITPKPFTLIQFLSGGSCPVFSHIYVNIY